MALARVDATAPYGVARPSSCPTLFCSALRLRVLCENIFQQADTSRDDGSHPPTESPTLGLSNLCELCALCERLPGLAVSMYVRTVKVELIPDTQ